MKTWKIKIVVAAILWTVLAVPAPAQKLAAGNDTALVNASFEDVENGLPAGWGRSTGTARYDDLTLELFSARTLKPKAAIDATATSAPIPKYIYGQFIEYLGRSIYQSIWAEMLEDRKFYFPVGDKESPWQAIGDPRNVRMNPILPYVGVHAPEIRMSGDGIPGGLVQDNPAVVAGKSYTGRIVASADPGALPLRRRRSEVRPEPWSGRLKRRRNESGSSLGSNGG